MRVQCVFPVLFLVGIPGVAVAVGQEPSQEIIANWQAPATWSSPRPHGLTTLSATSPLPFIGVTPCRIADTRGFGFSGQAGPPGLPANVPRTFQIAGVVSGVQAQCGIPASAGAVSFNFAVTSLTANGNLVVYPAGAPPPVVSSLNWTPSDISISNAPAIELGAGGSITVNVNGPNQTVDLIIDVNGYYAGAGVGSFNTFVGLDAGNFTMTGDANTGLGRAALQNNTTGSGNTGIGAVALANNTTGNANTAVGEDALQFNTTGRSNTAAGLAALALNTTGDNNTATGTNALSNNSVGHDNTAIGMIALASNSTGSNNTAIGSSALFFNTVGSSNVAIGAYALEFGSAGSDNIAIGFGAGTANTTGSHNIYIGSGGSTDESNQIRIGDPGSQNGTFIAGISGATSADGVPVLVNFGGRLGTTTSARRFKQDIRDIAEESDGLMRLRPVAFKYRCEIDPDGLPQYGLIAEEVAEVYPELVVCDAAGRPETVRYHLINALLLNEAQNQHRTIESQQAEIEGLKNRLAALEARLLAEPRP